MPKDIERSLDLHTHVSPSRRANNQCINGSVGKAAASGYNDSEITKSNILMTELGPESRSSSLCGSCQGECVRVLIGRNCTHEAESEEKQTEQEEETRLNLSRGPYYWTGAATAYLSLAEMETRENKLVHSYVT